MAGWLRSALADPDIESHLLSDEGEFVIDEVRRHWAAYWRPVVEGVVAVFFFAVFLFSPMNVGWLPALLFVGIALHAWWLALREHMDRFVITNMRVFRIRGVFARKLATMPITRILDITVVKSVTGRMLGYGHFTFESAAQEQGLRDIRFVGEPDRRDLTIQRVVQKSGARRSVDY